MTNHGMEDKIVNFLTSHKLSEIDCVYWNRRVDELRRIYAERQQYVNPINGKKKFYDLKQIKGITAKIKDLEERINTLLSTETVQKMILDILEKHGVGQNSSETYESKIVTSEKQIIELSNQGYECQTLGNKKWLMRKNI